MRAILLFLNSKLQQLLLIQVIIKSKIYYNIHVYNIKCALVI